MELTAKEYALLEYLARRADESALALVNGLASPTLTSFMRAVTYLGSNEFLAGAGACAVLALVVTRRGREAAALLLTMAGAALLNFTLKLLSGRERPEPFFGTPLPESYSFPSGHVLLSFCFYGMIAAVITARIEGAGRRASVRAVAVLLVALIRLSAATLPDGHDARMERMLRETCRTVGGERSIRLYSRDQGNNVIDNPYRRQYIAPTLRVNVPATCSFTSSTLHNVCVSRASDDPYESSHLRLII